MRDRTRKSFATTTRSILAAAFTCVLALPSATAAAAQATLQVACRGDESPISCWDRYNVGKTQETAKEAKKETEQTAKEDLKETTPSPNSGNINLQGNKENFLSLLSLTGILGSGAEEGNDGVMVFDVNLPFATDPNFKLQAAVNNEPQIAAGIQAALPEDMRDALTETLKKSVEELDDYSLSASYSWMSSRSGRGFSLYRNRFASLAEAVLRPFDEGDESLDRLADLNEKLQDLDANLAQAWPKSDEATEGDGSEHTELDRLIAVATSAAHGDRQLIDPNNTTFDEIGAQIQTVALARAVAGRPMGAAALTPAEEIALAQTTERQARGAVDQIRSEWQDAIQLEVEHLAELKAAYKKNGLDRYGDLIDNQPQLVAKAKATVRDPLVGGDEYSFSFTYEWSAANLNQAMSASCDKQMDTSSPSALDSPVLDACLADYKTYVDENSEAIDKGQRFSFSLEYSEVDAAKADISVLGLADLTAIDLPESDSLKVRLGWSREFKMSDGEPVLLDLVAEYDDVSNDPARRDRGVATLTVTRKFGGVSVPFGIVYANHGRFLGDVDERLSTHLGLRFDLDRDGRNDKGN